MAHLDDRTEAHIDGLRIAGDEGWEICKETLAWEEAGEVFTAAVLAFESGNEDRYSRLFWKQEVVTRNYLEESYPRWAGFLIHKPRNSSNVIQAQNHQNYAASV